MRGKSKIATRTISHFKGLLYVAILRAKTVMEEVTVTEFRQNLLEYLMANRGHRVRITWRGQLIAELSPPSASSTEANAARARLRHSVLRYDSPLESIIHPDEWKINR
jgi:antitoxin (DNA-binding transcriptional repressor) of toxin-antitoxin stability system